MVDGDGQELIVLHSGEVNDGGRISRVLVRHPLHEDTYAVLACGFDPLTDDVPRASLIITDNQANQQ